MREPVRDNGERRTAGVAAFEIREDQNRRLLSSAFLRLTRALPADRNSALSGRTAPGLGRSSTS